MMLNCCNQTSNVLTQIIDNGLVANKLASQIRGYPAGEVEQAKWIIRKYHAYCHCSIKRRRSRSRGEHLVNDKSDSYVVQMI